MWVFCVLICDSMNGGSATIRPIFAKYVMRFRGAVHPRMSFVQVSGSCSIADKRGDFYLAYFCLIFPIPMD